MKIRKPWGISLICLAAVLMIATTVPAEEMKTFKHIRLSTSYSSGHWFYECLEVIADEAKELSNGTLNVVIYPSSQLYKVSEIPSMLKRGTLEIGTVNQGYLLGSQPKQWGVFLPTYFKDQDHSSRFTYMTETGRMITQEDWIDHGMVPIARLFLMSDWAILSNKPIKTIADLKGIKVRMPGPFYNPMIKLHGMAPVTVSITETHMALSRGTVDAVFTTPGAMAMFKFYEVTKYFNMMKGFQNGSYTIGMSKKLWDKLAPEQKKAFLTAGYKATLHSFLVGMAAERKDIQTILAHTEDQTFSDAEAEKFLAKMRPVVKPVLNKYCPKDLPDQVFIAVEETRHQPQTVQEAVKIGYENSLERWGLDGL